MFNYIVNIHNSEGHLRHVLEGIKDVKGKDSEVFCVLDGCTDNSEAIVDDYGFFKIYTPNVRETEAINIALGQIPLSDRLFLIMQDDVLLEDEKFEEHILRIYQRVEHIGVLGFRHGANFKGNVLISRDHASETDLIVNGFQPDMAIPRLLEGELTQRQVVYKSPICISPDVIKKLGGYDSRFFPIAHDDTEYCIRAWNKGYRNYVCGIKLDQPVKWGGTRRFPKTHEDNLDMHKDHMNLIRQLYPEELKYLSANHPPLTKLKIW